MHLVTNLRLSLMLHTLYYELCLCCSDFFILANVRLWFVPRTSVRSLSAASLRTQRSACRAIGKSPLLIDLKFYVKPPDLALDPR